MIDSTSFHQLLIVAADETNLRGVLANLVKALAGPPRRVAAVTKLALHRSECGLAHCAEAVVGLSRAGQYFARLILPNRYYPAPHQSYHSVCVAASSVPPASRMKLKLSVAFGKHWRERPACGTYLRKVEILPLLRHRYPRSYV